MEIVFAFAAFAYYILSSVYYAVSLWSHFR